MTINLTVADIKNGERCVPTGCAIALALNRATGEQWTVGRQGNIKTDPYSWGATLTRKPRTGKRVYLPLPREAGIFAHGFDEGDDVQPFAFDWEPTP